MDHTIVSWDIPTHYNSLPSNSDHSHSRFIHWSHFSICVTATQNHFHLLLGISAARVTYPSPPPYWKMKEPGKEKVKLRNYSWPHPPEEFWEGSLASDYWSFEQYKTRLTNAEVYGMDFIFIILLHQLLGEGFWELVGRELARQGQQVHNLTNFI